MRDADGSAGLDLIQEELEVVDKKYDVAERRLGFPPKKRYRAYVGGHNVDTLIIERQWPSLAAMEAAYDKSFADPELQRLNSESAAMIKSNQVELYAPLP